MDLNTVVKRTNKVLATSLDDELVMFDADAGKYYNLNSVATEIWNNLDEARTVRELCMLLTDKFEITEEQCQKEVMEFLPRLKKKSLIDIVSSNGTE